MGPAQVLESLVRLVAGLGSYADARATVSGIVRSIVDEFGLEGAAIWQRTHDGYEPLGRHGAVIPDDVVRSAEETERQGERCRAWPLRANQKTVGVFAVRGELVGPVREVVRTPAGRCAHIQEDARRAGGNRSRPRHRPPPGGPGRRATDAPFGRRRGHDGAAGSARGSLGDPPAPP